MLTVRVRVYPALDKVAEARQHLSDWVRAAQGQGENLALAQRIYSSEGPMLLVTRRFDDLAAADATRRANLADAEWQGRVATLTSMAREPILQTLEETVVAIVPPSTPVGIVRRIFFHPAPDKVAQLRSTLSELVESRHADGHGSIGLSQQIYSAAGPLLVLTTIHADMAALDRLRQAQAAEVQAFVNSVAGLCRAPIAIRLLEVVVPFPS